MSGKASSDWRDTMINQFLSLDPEMAEKISAFEGRVIAIEVKGHERRLYLIPANGRIEIKDRYDAEPDTVLTGTPSALLRLSMSRSAAVLMLSGDIEITGDTRLGHEFKKLLNEIDIDWEEQLAGVLGDAPASQIMRFVGKLGSWGRNATDSITADLAEYLQEESRDVVTGYELENFYQEVDRLRNDVDRLEARIAAKQKDS